MLVPVTASWTGETRFEVRPCRWADGRRALWQPHLPGAGRPLFATPHSVRQRRAMACWLCDVCGHPLPVGDRWSLSREHLRDVDGVAAFLAVEPRVHLACARKAHLACPSLRGQMDAGVARLRLVRAADLVAQTLTPEAAAEFCGQPVGEPVIGHLKLRITAAVDHDPELLRRAA